MAYRATSRSSAAPLTLYGVAYRVHLYELYDHSAPHLDYQRTIVLYGDGPLDGSRPMIHGLTAADIARNLEALAAEIAAR